MKWLHNLTHTHPNLIAPETAPVQGFIALCAGKFNGKVKSAYWIPQGNEHWGYVIPPEMPISEVLDLLTDIDAYKAFISTARRTNE